MDTNTSFETIILNKDYQIKLLEERLSFALKQLDDKEKQIEHYKALVKTMHELLESNRAASSKERTTPNSKQQSLANNRTPPGFENNKFSIKGRKIQSFHFGDTPQQTSPGDDNSYYYRQMYPSVTIAAPDTSEEEDDVSAEEFVMNHHKQQQEEEIVIKSPSQVLKKSKSHTSLAQISNVPSKEQEQRRTAHLSASTSVLPNLPKNSKSYSPNSTNQSRADTIDWRTAGKLTKSRSMTSVYSALEENKLDMKFPELEQMAGQIYQLSKYQQGCRFLQKQLEDDSKNVGVILNELYDHLTELMTDPFGNYLFTKLVECCDQEQRNKLLLRILPELSNSAFDMYGTQSMQKIMPFLSDEQIDAMIASLKPTVIPLIKHNKANYLIQYFLDKQSPPQQEWIYEAVLNHMEEIARDKVGCVIIKRCVDHANEKQLAAIVDKIKDYTLSLVQDPFGNYAVQHILQKFPQNELSSKLVVQLLGNLAVLCTQKFSSNVVETCLNIADLETRKKLLEELIECEPLPQLLNDRFANFVIQTALDVAETDQRMRLVKKILPHLGNYTQFTKRLQKKILQL